MKKQLAALLAWLCSGASICAQTNAPTEGVPYFLPKTAIRVAVLVEKTVYTPGELARYGEKYMKLFNIEMESKTTYRVVGLRFSSYGIPDSTKYYVAAMDKKHSIVDVQRADNGVLLAINAKPSKVQQPASFTPARRLPLLDPKDFMNQDILAAGSSAKMAELIAKDLYDIRDSRNQLSRGQAETMPKDGEQLRLMLASLDQQEKALMQVFEGTTVRDTTETVFHFVPTKEVKREVLFRFSKHYGLTDKDDLGGAPYYISVEDQRIMPTLTTTVERGKTKDNPGVYVNLPGKVKLLLYQDTQLRLSQELYMAQFGKTEPLGGELFSKKMLTRMVLNPVTGNLESILTETLK